MSAEFRIEFTIMRRRDGEEDFTEIGFGSSGAWSEVDQAMYMASSTVQNREWETSPGMPEPRDAVDEDEEEDHG